jgi:hypothetical protein
MVSGRVVTRCKIQLSRIKILCSDLIDNQDRDPRNKYQWSCALIRCVVLGPSPI